MDEKLEKICADLGCSTAQRFEIADIAKRLRIFNSQKLWYKSPKNRKADLEKIGEHIKGLSAMLHNLDPRDFELIRHRARDSNKELKLHEISEGPWSETLAASLEFVSAALPGVMDHIENTTNPKGRTELSHLYAFFLRDLASFVPMIKPGAGGDFQKLCNAVFEFAEVPATAEGALKKMLTEYTPQQDSVTGAWSLERISQKSAN